MIILVENNRIYIFYEKYYVQNIFYVNLVIVM